MSDKPVYIAGQGFQSSDDKPPHRSRLALLLVLLALAAGVVLALRLSPSGRTLLFQVQSEPAGAEILIDLKATGKRTPAELQVPAPVPFLLQVRLDGHEADPTALRVDGARLRRGQLFRFALRPLPAAAPLPSAPLPPAGEATRTNSDAQAVGRPVGVGGLLLGTLAESAPAVGAPGDSREQLEISWLRWDPAFRLKVDGQILSVSAARALPAGTHRLQVDLAGRSLLDTLLAGQGPRRLVLPAREKFVEIQVSPPEAEIVVGEVVLGQGRVLLRRADLPLDLRFPALPGLLPPAALRVAADAPGVLSVRHHEPLRLSWSPAGESGLRLAARGYVMPGAEFQEDTAHGPRLEGDQLLLGRAFHDRRPGGSQAAVFRFELPADQHADWPVELSLSAGDSGQRYPLTLTRGATLTVLLNGTALARDLVLGADEQRRGWPVSSLLKAGSNQLTVQSSEASRSATRLRVVELRVGP